MNRDVRGGGMEENILTIDDFYIKAGVEFGRCPIDWLAEYYKKYAGKLVMLDDELLLYLLNKTHYVSCEVEQDKDEYKTTYTLVYKAGKYPEVRVVIASYGSAAEYQTENGEYVVEDFNKNWHMIEELVASDIVEGNTYAKNKQTDEQLIHLVSEGASKVDVLSL